MEKNSKKIIITGSSSNIARELIIKLEKYNLKIFSCTGKKKSNYRFDFSSLHQIEKFIKFLKKIKPNYLFICHGVLQGKKLSKYSKKNITDTVNINLISKIRIIEEVANIKNLNTVVISSISGRDGSFDNLYAATQAGINVIAKSIIKKIHKSSRLNIVSPGIVFDAKMTLVRKDFKNLNIKKRKTPTKKFTSSKEIAELVELLLINPKNINGENININGGL